MVKRKLIGLKIGNKLKGSISCLNCIYLNTHACTLSEDHNKAKTNKGCIENGIHVNFIYIFTHEEIEE